MQRFLPTGLLALGLEPGDRVGIWGPNSYEWVLTQFATAKIGAILVNVNPAYRLFELEFVLNKVECKAIIAAEKFKSSEYLNMLKELAPELASCEPGYLRADKLPQLTTVIRMGDVEHHAALLHLADDLVAERGDTGVVGAGIDTAADGRILVADVRSPHTKPGLGSEYGQIPVDGQAGEFLESMAERERGPGADPRR